MRKSAKSKKEKNPRRSRSTVPQRGPRASKSAGPKEHTASPSGTRENSKLAGLIAMLRRREGTTIEQMMKVTGWKAHSVRGAISGALKKKLGLTITSDKVDGIRSYRIAADA